MPAYVAERLPLRLFVPLAFTLACAAHAGSASRSPLAIVADAAVLLVLLAQFRIWDDLADRAADASAHPERVLVRSPRPGVFRWTCWGLGVLAGAILATAYPGRGGVAALAACHVGAAIWYARRGPRSALGDHVLLAKYPAFVFVIAVARGVDRTAVLVCSAVAVYLAACLYEVLHDPRSPSAPNALLVSCEAVLLVVSTAAAAIGAFA